MKNLADYCDPALFGRNHEAVYDESYRKAGKLDNEYFSTHIVPQACGLVDCFEDTLMEGHSTSTSFYCELYKLNVYGMHCE